MENMENMVENKTPGYGRLLYEKLRAEGKNPNELSQFERFVLDRGFYYETEEDLRCGYDRAWKSSRDILWTAEEFQAEVDIRRRGCGTTVDTAPLYEVLVDLARQNKLKPKEVNAYAGFGWCLRHPEAVIACETGRNQWTVNNCDTEISKAEARVMVCEKWGFKASRMSIIGTPYYDASDWQFIRFNCARMAWLWANEDLFQVYS